MAKPAISILWLKRDLRWQDHAALQSALHAGLPLLAIYLKEPTQWDQIQYSDRQWQFVWDSVAAMNEVLGQQKVHALGCEAMEFFEAWNNYLRLKASLVIRKSAFNGRSTGISPLQSGAKSETLPGMNSPPSVWLEG